MLLLIMYIVKWSLARISIFVMYIHIVSVSIPDYLVMYFVKQFLAKNFYFLLVYIVYIFLTIKQYPSLQYARSWVLCQQASTEKYYISHNHVKCPRIDASFINSRYPGRQHRDAHKHLQRFPLVPVNVNIMRLLGITAVGSYDEEDRDSECAENPTFCIIKPVEKPGKNSGGRQ